MFEVKVITHFSAAHYLKEYKGKCEELHGHNWKVEVTVEAKKLDKKGMVIDFKELRRILNEVVMYMDHKFLNEIPPFLKYNTTSEVIAQYIFKEFKKKLIKYLKIKRTKAIRVKEVSVWEQGDSCAIYREA